MNGRKRTVQIKFRVTEAERDLILEKMKLIPTDNMAAYLRKIAIDGYIIQVDHTDIKAMTAEIQKIGVNVNQIAKRANATGNVYQEDIEEIKGVLAEIWRLQRCIITVYIHTVLVTACSACGITVKHCTGVIAHGISIPVISEVKGNRTNISRSKCCCRWQHREGCDRSHDKGRSLFE